MKEIKKLKILGEKLEKKLNKLEGEYGGPSGGKFELPPNHKAGTIVPHGGSSCGNCKFGEMRDDGPHCNSKYWVKWNAGNSRLPVDDPLNYCSDFWESKE